MASSVSLRSRPLLIKILNIAVRHVRFLYGCVLVYPMYKVNQISNFVSGLAQYAEANF